MFFFGHVQSYLVKINLVRRWCCNCYVSMPPVNPLLWCQLRPSSSLFLRCIGLAVVCHYLFVFFILASFSSSSFVVTVVLDGLYASPSSASHFSPDSLPYSVMKYISKYGQCLHERSFGSMHIGCDKQLKYDRHSGKYRNTAVMPWIESCPKCGNRCTSS